MFVSRLVCCWSLKATRFVHLPLKLLGCSRTALEKNVVIRVLSCLVEPLNNTVAKLCLEIGFDVSAFKDFGCSIGNSNLINLWDNKA